MSFFLNNKGRGRGCLIYIVLIACYYSDYNKNIDVKIGESDNLNE